MSFISGKNGSFGFFSVWLCVGKNQMCHLCGGNYHIFFFLHAAKNHLSLFRWFRSFTMNANVWRYEKLPITGDFLSSYTKVEAGYNP
jgi:hypothetical protein